MHPLAHFGSLVRREDEHVFAAGATGHDHAFGQTELHLTRGEVRNAHDLPADEFLGFVSRLDAGEHLLVDTAAERQLELEQLPRLGHQLGFDHASNSQIDLQEIVERALVRQRLRR
jgi:hypothetical protein